MTYQSALADREREKTLSRRVPNKQSTPTGGSIQPMSTNEIDAQERIGTSPAPDDHTPPDAGEGSSGPGGDMSAEVACPQCGAQIWNVSLPQHLAGCDGGEADE